MCVNKIKLKIAYKNNQHFLAILGTLAIDKRRKERLLTISIAFLLLDR